MAKSAPLRPHPLCSAFPEMSPEDYARLRWSIQQGGFDKAQPVVLYEGKILDGRHRYRAARELEIDFPTRVFKGSEEEAIEYVNRLNLARRHLSLSQLSMVGATLKPYFEKAAKERQRQGQAKLPDPSEAGDSRDKAAEAVGVSPRSITSAEYVAENSPKLAEKVLAGEMSLNAAVQEVKAKETRKGPPPRPKKSEPEPEKIGEVIREGQAIFRRIIGELAAVRRDLLDLPDKELGRELNKPRIKLAFENIENYIKFSVPYAACPMNDPCSESCRLCRGSQWITREQKERYDERNKK